MRVCLLISKNGCNLLDFIIYHQKLKYHKYRGTSQYELSREMMEEMQKQLNYEGCLLVFLSGSAAIITSYCKDFFSSLFPLNFFE